MIATPGCPTIAVSPRSRERSARLSARSQDQRPEKSIASSSGSARAKAPALQRPRIERVAPRGASGASARPGPRRARARLERGGPRPDARGSPRTGSAPPPSRRRGASPGLRRSAPSTRTRPSATITRCTRSSIAAKPAAGGGADHGPPPARARAPVGHERGRVRAQQSHRHHDLVAVPRDLERLLQADAVARQVGLERHAPGARFLRDDGREAQALEIHGRPGAAEGPAASAADHRAPVNRTEVPDAPSACAQEGWQARHTTGLPPSSANTMSSRSVVTRTRAVLVSSAATGLAIAPTSRSKPRSGPVGGPSRHQR